MQGNKTEAKETVRQTLFLSLMEPLPRTEIFAPVSSCSLLIVLPWGPKSFPTKLTCNKFIIHVSTSETPLFPKRGKKKLSRVWEISTINNLLDQLIESPRWLGRYVNGKRHTLGYCLVGMRTRSLSFRFLVANRSRYVSFSGSFLVSPFWILSISAGIKHD